MVTNPEALAFSSSMPMLEPRPKPRKTGLTEIRDRTLGYLEVKDLCETIGPYVDAAKYTCGAQRLFPREFVARKNALYASHQIDVSSGGLLERVVQQGERAVHAFLEESRELGFTIIEISTGLTILSQAAKCALIRTVKSYGLKAKPEAAMTYGTGVRGDEQVKISADRLIADCVACMEAGADMIMVEEEGIFQYVKERNADLVHRLVRTVGLENLMFEASDGGTVNWLVKNYGPEVNVFTDPSRMYFVATLRAGIWGMSDTFSRLADFRGEAG